MLLSHSKSVFSEIHFSVFSPLLLPFQMAGCPQKAAGLWSHVPGDEWLLAGAWIWHPRLFHGWVQTRCRREPHSGFSWGMPVRAQGRLLPKCQDEKHPNRSANPPLRYRVLPRKSVLFRWRGSGGDGNLSVFNLRGNASTTHTQQRRERMA